MEDAAPDQNGQPRDHHGRFVQQVETIEKDAESARLRALGWTYQRISTELWDGNPGTAHKAVRRAYGRIVREPAQEALDLELTRLDMLLERAMDVVERKHLAISNGKVVHQKIAVPVLDAAGQQVIDPTTDKPLTEDRWVPVEDDAPLLNAIAQALRISESRRKLLGLDAPAKKRVEVITTDQFTEAMKELADQIDAQEARIARRQAAEG